MPIAISPSDRHSLSNSDDAWSQGTHRLRHYSPGDNGMTAMWKQNPYASQVPRQQIAIIPSFTLECGQELHNAPVAYTTHGRLSKAGDNAIVVCHALSGSADLSDWWAPMLGSSASEPLDTSRFFVVCLNSLGSPYGSASPMTYVDGDVERGRYGPDFPPTTIRDDVNIHQLVLADLGVRSIAAVIGGSMGGMLALEYSFFGSSYVRSIVTIASSAAHSAWCIGWGEMQRQSIYNDPNYHHGYYSLDDPPRAGLSTARMAAMMMYRSRDSFQRKFSRNVRHSPPTKPHSRASAYPTPPRTPSPSGPRVRHVRKQHARKTAARLQQQHQPSNIPQLPQSQPYRSRSPKSPFAAETYLSHQGNKFVARFDANCYVATTLKLDTHDISRGRSPLPSLSRSPSPCPDPTPPPFPCLDCPTKGASGSQSTPMTPTAHALSQVSQPVLVLGISSDLLFPCTEQIELASKIPNARFELIESEEGHDGFLLEGAQVGRMLGEFLNGFC